MFWGVSAVFSHASAGARPLTFDSDSGLSRDLCTLRRDVCVGSGMNWPNSTLGIVFLHICFFSEGRRDSCFVAVPSHLVPMKMNNLNPDSLAGVRPLVCAGLRSSGLQPASGLFSPPAWPVHPCQDLDPGPGWCGSVD